MQIKLGWKNDVEPGMFLGSLRACEDGEVSEEIATIKADAEGKLVLNWLVNSHGESVMRRIEEDAKLPTVEDVQAVYTEVRKVV